MGLLFFSFFSDLNKLHHFKYCLSSNNSQIRISRWIPSWPVDFYMFFFTHLTQNLHLVSDRHISFICPNLISSTSPLNLFFPKSSSSQLTPTLAFQLLSPKASISSLTLLVLSQSIIHQIANSPTLRISSEYAHFTPLPPGPTYYVSLG